MRSFLNFLRNHLFLSAVMFASIVLLISGLLLIQAAQVPSESMHTDVAPGDQSLVDSPVVDIPPLPEIDRNPPADLPTVQAALQDMAKGVTENLEMAADELSAALAEAEPGSESWCDLMLIKPDADWTPDESKLFAQRCI